MLLSVETEENSVKIQLIQDSHRPTIYSIQVVWGSKEIGLL
jgi:hypothetical protein